MISYKEELALALDIHVANLEEALIDHTLAAYVTFKGKVILDSREGIPSLIEDFEYDPEFEYNPEKDIFNGKILFNNKSYLTRVHGSDACYYWKLVKQLNIEDVFPK